MVQYVFFYGTIFLVSSVTAAVKANVPSQTEKELDSAIGKSLQDARYWDGWKSSTASDQGHTDRQVIQHADAEDLLTISSDC